MSSDIKENQQYSKELTKNTKPPQTGYISWWLFRTKGTVSEPWPTAEELWTDPEVKKIIQDHNSEVQKRNNSSS